MRNILALLVLTFTFPALAAEEKKPVTYSPDFCEFEVTFPEEPYTSQRCDDDGGRCHELVSYTQVYDMSTTVNFRVVCNETEEEGLLEAYGQDVMEATLRAMTKQTVVKEYNSSYREGNGYKQAGLVGEGQTGRTPMIYIAQMWIGKNSAMTVEAELIGDAHGDADKLFADVLRSAVALSDKPEAPIEEESSEEEKSED